MEQLFNELEKKGLELWAEKDTLRWRAPMGAIPAALFADIIENKASILDLLKKRKADGYSQGTGHNEEAPLKEASIAPYENAILLGDCLDKLKEFPDNSIDQIVTDPPYGMKFMGKDWDKAVPSVEIWREALRVLKPGSLAFVMSIPRQDCLSRMIVNLEDAGFEIGFTSLYWTHAQGFPKAHNIGKAAAKRVGAKREHLGCDPYSREGCDESDAVYQIGTAGRTAITEADSEPAVRLVGAYGGFQPKPAVEVVLVVMKPMDEETMLDQAFKNGKGITWLDDCRIPYNDEDIPKAGRRTADYFNEVGKGKKTPWSACQHGRFPANLIASDGVLDGSGGTRSYGRFFSLDVWSERKLPFLVIPRAKPKEKGFGLDGGQETKINNGRDKNDTPYQKGTTLKNSHPTVKPIELMAYLITMGSREDDVVLDPFAGSGTTCLAAKSLKRRYIGIELKPEYLEIAQKRLEAHEENYSKPLLPESPEPLVATRLRSSAGSMEGEHSEIRESFDRTFQAVGPVRKAFRSLASNHLIQEGTSGASDNY